MEEKTGEYKFTFEDFLEMCQHYPMSKQFLPGAAKAELKEYNIIEEYEALKNLLKKKLNHKDRLYKQARFNLLQYIITCVEHDENQGNYYSEENKQLAVEAGKMLFEEGGMNSMHDMLVWSFIPRRYHREIDYFFDGIGEWKC